MCCRVSGKMIRHLCGTVLSFVKVSNMDNLVFEKWPVFVQSYIQKILWKSVFATYKQYSQHCKLHKVINFWFSTSFIIHTKMATIIISPVNIEVGLWEFTGPRFDHPVSVDFNSYFSLFSVVSVNREILTTDRSTAERTASYHATHENNKLIFRLSHKQRNPFVISLCAQQKEWSGYLKSCRTAF